MALSVNILNSCTVLSVSATRYNPASTQADIIVENSSGGGVFTTTMAYDFATGKGIINIPVGNLSSSYGVFKLCLEENGVKYACKPLLIKCDIDCCLTKLTNELVDCDCDCPRCAKSLAKAQKIFLLLQSAISAVDLAAGSPGVTSASYYDELVSKYNKARELCDNSCGCDC